MASLKLQLERTQARLAEMSSDLAEAVAARAELTKAIEKLTAKLPVNDQQNPHQA